MYRWILIVSFLLLPNLAAAEQINVLIRWTTNLPTTSAAKLDDRLFEKESVAYWGSSPIWLYKPVDDASPLLRQAQETGKVLPRVIIKRRDRRASSTALLLRNVRVKQISKQRRKEGRTLEKVGLTVEAIKRVRRQ